MSYIWKQTIPAGGKWSGRIGRGKSVTFTAQESGANVSVLLYNAYDLTERYNMPDTLKAQHTAHLTKGHVLMSDNGRAFASITADTTGWHDTISGYTTRSLTHQKYGASTYQESRNEWRRNGEENFSMELLRNGLITRDLVPNLNIFSKVYCDEEGNMNFVSSHCKKGDFITLRTEMDLLFLLSNTPNPLDPSGTYPSVPIEITVDEAAPLNSDDYCLNFRPENKRAFENTWSYDLLLGNKTLSTI
ncbi:urea amidolyase associated protein UAAP1 [Priestia aryabhattai]|uniref:urea amidolyase associated protein UAAP1 n=1 Tax=Priestia aryabhattai TaxID=412384 RepID=UPI003B676744